jgi:hypothetical protein
MKASKIINCEILSVTGDKSTHGKTQRYIAQEAYTWTPRGQQQF